MAEPRRNDWKTLRTLLPYLWEHRARVILALVCLVTAKVANVTVPILLKHIVDALDGTRHPVLVMPIALFFGFGVLRLAAALFGELRDLIFARVTQGAVRRIALKVFRHLHSLSLSFHLDRQTGGVSRDIERGSRGITFLLNFTLFNILPTVVEITLIAAILLVHFQPSFAIITFLTVLSFIAFTLLVTEWRMKFRRTMNELDSSANTKAIDSLLNYETVKYFGNEEYEARRYDGNLANWETAAVRNQTSLSLLNIGQGMIIALGTTVLLYLAGRGVVDKTLSLGDLVMINAYLLQLFIPMNFLGFVYREIRNSLADMEKMFALLGRSAEIADKLDAKPLIAGHGEVRFERVNFSYQKERQILFDIDFTIPAGEKVAVVGPSGSGKSTLVRLLFRFYEPDNGRILINGCDIANVTQSSLRQAVGIVPQDTVLFNDTIYYNIAYAKPDAPREAVVEAARMAHIHDFVESLPTGYDTRVGERGLKLSGGEKQRIAIARTILKNPGILVFDEATSALDSRSERAIQKSLDEVAANHTTLMIAHRLSTVVDAHNILVLEHGRIVETGTHASLLEQNGVYAHMWRLQQKEKQRIANDRPVLGAEHAR